MQLFLRSGFVLLIGLLVLASEVSLVGAQHRFLNLRQTKHGEAVRKNRPSEEDLVLNLSRAQKLAEQLDAQATMLNSFSSLGFLQRWRQGIEIEKSRAYFSLILLDHLKALTVVMEARPSSGGFKKLREFEFQNALRKSDYLLSLEVTKASVDHLLAKAKMGAEVLKVVNAYNFQRTKVDQRKITLVGSL